MKSARTNLFYGSNLFSRRVRCFGEELEKFCAIIRKFLRYHFAENGCLQRLSMANAPRTPHRSLRACRNAQGRRCSRTSLRIWLIMRKPVRFRSLIDEVAGDRLDTCGRHRRYSTRCETNLKVIKVNWERNLRHFHLYDRPTPRLRSTGEGLHARIPKSWTVVLAECSSFWCGVSGGAVEAEGALYWRSSDSRRPIEGLSGMLCNEMYH